MESVVRIKKRETRILNKRRKNSACRRKEFIIKMKEYYQILGLEATATDAEIAARYQELKAKYSEERWLDGEAGNEAAKMLTKIDMAYRELTAARKEQSQNTEGQSAYEEIAKLLKEEKLNEAQTHLDNFNERGAEWHFLLGCVMVKRGAFVDAQRQFDIAVSMDPYNQEYRTAREHLRRQANGYGGGYNTTQRGGCSGCDICSGLLCADCCCECCGGDLISCC